MKKNVFWLRLFLPVLVMSLLLGIILLEQEGIMVEARDTLLGMLSINIDDAQSHSEQQASVIIVYDATDDYETSSMQTVADTLNAMRVSWHTVDLSSQKLPPLSQAGTLLLCTRSLQPLESKLEDLMGWIESGGKFALMMAPRIDTAFRIFYRKLGITELGTEYTAFHSLRYTTGLLPLWEGKTFDDDLWDYAMTVRLEPDCIVHMQSADGTGVPLLWERTVGKGRVAVFNNTLLKGKDSRGYAAAILFALHDTVAYPIMNAGMVYLDDFPAPQPEGYQEALFKAYGYDIQGMFRNHWWPDMKSLTWKYGLRYTGVLVETYNRAVIPPFEPEEGNTTLFRYYASELLASGGEIGLHGYNHMPLCPDGFPYRDEDYATWPSQDDMRASIQELVRYGKTLSQNVDFDTYVPPSNYLSEEGRKALLSVVPDLKVISGLYLNETGVNAHVQEFCEEADGTVSVPRISSGFTANDNYTGYIIAQELLLHGAFSHFIHPDDILDESRGSSIGWAAMFTNFSGLIASVATAYPELRFSTSTEGAAAVQRYDRLTVERTETDEGLQINLKNFYDSAWLALRARRIPASILGGEIFRVSEGFYWIRADAAEISIRWEEGT